MGANRESGSVYEVYDVFVFVSDFSFSFVLILLAEPNT